MQLDYYLDVLKYVITNPKNYIQFTSLNYIAFLLIAMLLYYVVPRKGRFIVLFVANIVFYLCGGWKKFAFITVAGMISWLVSYRVHCIYKKADADKPEGENGKPLRGKALVEYMKPYKKKSRIWTALGVILVLGALVYCKFGKMVLEAFGSLENGENDAIKIIVPLGISYYTFSIIGYMLDVYWRKQQCILNPVKYFTCVMYFPKVVQGPIAKLGGMAKQLDEPAKASYKGICFGAQRMLYGYMKKLIIADRLAIITANVFGNIESYEGFVFVFALICSTLQLYMDFSACMDIVIGTSELFGIRLEENFKQPFFSKSIAEFWRRWHITLGVWFKDYVYMPIVTSGWMTGVIAKLKTKGHEKAAKNIGTIIPLAIVWLLTGLWHGTGMNYIIWGIYYGLIIISSVLLADIYGKMANRCKIDTSSRSWKLFQMVRTFFLFTVARLITAPGTLDKSVLILKRMFMKFNPNIFIDKTLYTLGLDEPAFRITFIGIILVWLISIYQDKCGSFRECIARRNIVLRWLIYYAMIFSIVIFGLYGSGYNAGDFVYAGF